MPGTALGGWRETLALLARLSAQAAEGGADIVVLPEGAWPAYVLGSKAAYRAARAGGMPPPVEFLARMQAVAQAARIAVCVGHVEETESPAAGMPELRNAVSFINPDGHLAGTRHKCFLWDFDHAYYSPGERVAPVDTALGRVGMLVCADARLPEMAATLIARGAQVLVQPTAWVNAGTPEAPWNPQPEFLIPSRAAEFHVPFASASKWGAEGAGAFVGGSLICGADGRVLVRCDPDETGVRLAEVTVGETRRPILTADERAYLLRVGPAAPTRADVPPLRVSVAKAAAAGVCDRSDPTPGEPELIIVRSEDGLRPPARRLIGRRAFLSAPAPDVFELRGIRIGALAAGDAGRFAAARRLALEGAHVIVFFGDAPMMMLQSRACENRVFVVAAAATGVRAFDPRGLPVGAGVSGENAREVLLDVSAAAGKVVAPGTDVIAGRRTELYEF